MRAKGAPAASRLRRGWHPTLHHRAFTLKLSCLVFCIFGASASHAQLKTNSVLESLKPATTQAALPAEEAFRLSQLADATTLRLTWQIAPNHYLYQQKFELTGADGRLIPFVAPPASVITDEFFGETAVYFDAVQLEIPLDSLTARDREAGFLQIIYQGCAKELYCYPPQQLRISL